MPAFLLGTADAARFDVVGSRRPDTNIVDHVGLLAAPSALNERTAVDIQDMGPPLNIAPPSRFHASVLAVLPLTRDEQEGVDEWLAELLPRSSLCTYLATPAARLRRDEDTGQIIAWEFSCAGFVAAAYEHGAAIRLVDQEQLPPLSYAQASHIWAHSNERVFARFAARFGLSGPGPWPVLLPGHLIHALARGRAALPYRPRATDIAFPERPRAGPRA